MEISIKIEELQKRKLFIATPMYGGMCAGMYTKSTNDLSALCMHYKVEAKFYYLFNESLITRARNYCVDEFMRSNHYCVRVWFIWFGGDLVTILIKSVKSYRGDLIICLDEEFSWSVADI